MRFTDFYAGNAVCASSRYSLMTGKHPEHAVVRGNFEIGDWDSFLGQLPIPEHEFLYWEYFNADYSWTLDTKTKRTGLKSQAVRVGKWKAIRHDRHQDFSGAPVEFTPLDLYNLEEDVAESNNVASQHPEVVKYMLGLMRASHSPSEHFNFYSR